MKKSLVLLGIKDNDMKGVITFEQDGEMVDGKLRLYNFSSEPNGILSVGIYNNGNVKKAGLSKVSNMYYKFKIEDLPEKFSCALVNFCKSDVKALLYGSTDGVENKVFQLGKVMSSTFEEYKSVEETKKVLNENQIEYDEEYEKEIEKDINEELKKDEKKLEKCEERECVNCSTCKYKKAFFEDEKILTDEEENKNFFDEIKGQILPLFDKNEREEFLEKLIPNSKWVKVDYEDGDYYILGLVYENDVLKYLVYGVPGIYQKNPPLEISGYPMWFPLDKERKESFGYWLSYQDVETGESVKAVVE